jgi:hypothetical protein
VTSDFLGQPPIVAFLVINQIPHLPALAINSVLQYSSSQIVVGIVSEEDKYGLPESPRITYMDLKADAQSIGLKVGGGAYESFDVDSFFSLVQLKWNLFSKILNEYPKSNLIYNDIDVFWLRPVAEIIEDTFRAFSQTQVLIQHFTWDPNSPQLCMGFVAFRNSNESKILIDECSRLHSKMLMKTPRTGDDDVITHFFTENSQPLSIQLLPQSTFPVGNQLSLFSRKSAFPGLRPFDPYIYHANFVVGAKKKLLIATIMFRSVGLSYKSIPIAQRAFLRIMLKVYKLVFLFRRITKIGKDVLKLNG